MTTPLTTTLTTTLRSCYFGPGVYDTLVGAPDWALRNPDAEIVKYRVRARTPGTSPGDRCQWLALAAFWASIADARDRRYAP